MLRSRNSDREVWESPWLQPGEDVKQKIEERQKLLELVSLALEGLVSGAGVLGVDGSLVENQGGGLENTAGLAFDPDQGVVGVTKTPPPPTDFPNEITVKCCDRYVKNHNPNHHHPLSKQLNSTV